MDTRAQAASPRLDVDGEDAAQRAIRDLMDPGVLEARLEGARARRAEALAAKGKDSRRAGHERRWRASPDDVPPEALTPLRNSQAVAERTRRANEPLRLPSGAGARAQPAGNEPRRDAGEGLIEQARSESAPDDAGRSAPVPAVSTPSDVARVAALSRAPSRTGRSLSLAAAALLSGVALGVAGTTLIPQLQGWQIVIVPPGADIAPEGGPGAETQQTQVETAEAESAAALRSGGDGRAAVDARDAEADAVPLPSAADAPYTFQELAAAAEDAPAQMPPPDLPAPDSPTSVPSTPALPPVSEPGSPEAHLAALVEPDPRPVAGAQLPEAPPLGSGAPALPALPAEVAPEQTTRPAAEPPHAALPSSTDHGVVPAAPPQRSAPPEQDRMIASPDARVAVHYPPEASTEADEVSTALTGAGLADVSTRSVSLNITAPNVRYFHEGDRAAAEDVASVMSAALDGVDFQVRDFTGFQPRPEQGLVEVWLSGDAPPPVARSVAAPSRDAVTSRRAAERQAERERLVRSIEQRLRERLR